MDRKWVVVAFSDILGFGIWRRRASNTPEIAEPFIRRFYDEIESFIQKNDDFHLKYLGDGFLAIEELERNKEPTLVISSFIKKMNIMTEKIGNLVRTCDWPMPEGFRTRLVAGHVSKLIVVDPNDTKKKIPEYVGYAVNLAQRLLEISPSSPFICHESVVKILGSHRKNFKLQHLGNPKERPRGVDSEDLNGLWLVGI